MTYKITLKKRVLKALEKINDPYYSNIRVAIYALGNNPRPKGYIKLKGINSYRIIGFRAWRSGGFLPQMLIRSRQFKYSTNVHTKNVTRHYAIPLFLWAWLRCHFTEFIKASIIFFTSLGTSNGLMCPLLTVMVFFIGGMPT